MERLGYCLIAAAALLSYANATNYCSSTICRNVKHISCGHNGKFSSTCPTDAKMITLSSTVKNSIVREHNARRNFIAGGRDSKHSPACRMATMQWDNELATLAALNVRQCTMKHDKCHNTDAFKYSGQNLAWRSFALKTTPNVQDMFTKAINEQWYGEVKNSKMAYINSYPSNYNGPVIGHFTVMVADRNTRVGCAAATYTVRGDKYSRFLMACNYATTNMIGKAIYASCSKAASGCKKGKNSALSNLCSTTEVYNVNAF